MSSLTTNLKLVKPELQDNITPTIFADNFDKIDAALEGVSGGALSLEEIEASTNLDGKIPSAAALKEVNNRLNNISMELDYANAIEISMNASQTVNYTPSKNGFIFITGYGSANSYIACGVGTVRILQQATSNNYVGFTFPVTKGVATGITTSNITTNRKIWFVPYK